VSDALKRAAVKFGIGRYLYHSKSGWEPYDPDKKRFVKMPVFPSQQPANLRKATEQAKPPPTQAPSSPPAEPTINDEQALRLKGHIINAGQQHWKEFATEFKISKLSDLAAQQYQRAERWILAKMKPEQKPAN